MKRNVLEGKYAKIFIVASVLMEFIANLLKIISMNGHENCLTDVSIILKILVKNNLNLDQSKEFPSILQKVIRGTNFQPSNFGIKYRNLLEIHCFLAMKNQSLVPSICSNIEFLLKHNLPANVAASLRGMSILVDSKRQTNNQAFLQIIRMLYLMDGQVFPYIFHYRNCCEDFSLFISNFLIHPLNSQIPPTFLDKVKRLFIENTRKASIENSLSFLTLLAQRDINLITKLFSLSFDSSSVLSAVEESYQFVVSNSQNTKNLENLQKTLLNFAANRFVQFPNIRLGKFILQLLNGLKNSHSDVDSASFLFGDLSKRVSSFVSLFTVLCIYLMRSDKDEQEKCASIVQQNTDTFSLSSRSQAMMLSCAGVKDSIGLAFEMAASETDDVSLITQSYESF